MRASLCMLTVLQTANALRTPSLRMSTQLPTSPQRRRLFQAAGGLIAFRAYEAPAASKTTRVLCETFAKPQTDSKSYRLIELASGVRCLLVQDPRAEKCAAALDVHVGHMSDPVDRPGLAHFCEHMLFLGTEKYPDESEYNQYLNQHGGAAHFPLSARALPSR